MIDLSDRTVAQGFIDTRVHLTMDASNLAQQTLESSAAKVLKGLHLAPQYLRFGFTTPLDLGSMDVEFPTVDLRNAITNGLVPGPRLLAAPMWSAPRPATATWAASMHRARVSRYRRSPTDRRRSGGSCAASTPMGPTGSRP